MSRCVLPLISALILNVSLTAAERVVWRAEAPLASMTNAVGAKLPNDWYATNTWYHWGAISLTERADGSLVVVGGKMDEVAGNTLGITCASSDSDVWLRYTVGDVAIHAEGFRSFSGPRIVDGERSTPMLGGNPGTLEPGLYLINVAQTFATFPVGNPLLRFDCTGMQVGLRDLQLVREPDLRLVVTPAGADVEVVVQVAAPALEVSVKLMDPDHQALPLSGKSELNLKSSDQLTWRAVATLPPAKDGQPWKPSALLFKAQPIPVKGGKPIPALFTANSLALGK
jgi:hypothetical protein